MEGMGDALVNLFWASVIAALLAGLGVGFLAHKYFPSVSIKIERAN
jgi:hypothetical protein